MSPFQKSRGIVWAAACLLVTATGCSRLTSQTSIGKAATSKDANPLEITAGKDLLQRITTGEPAWADVGASLTVAARVEVDDTRITRVGSPVMGRITSLEVREGQEVHQ